MRVEKDLSIRAVYMNGSHTNPNALKDIYQINRFKETYCPVGRL